MKGIVRLALMTVGGWLGWWLGDFVGLFTGVALSAIGSGAGLWVAIKLERDGLE